MGGLFESFILQSFLSLSLFSYDDYYKQVYVLMIIMMTYSIMVMIMMMIFGIDHVTMGGLFQSLILQSFLSVSHKTADCLSSPIL